MTKSKLSGKNVGTFFDEAKSHEAKELSHSHEETPPFFLFFLQPPDHS